MNWQPLQGGRRRCAVCIVSCTCEYNRSCIDDVRPLIDSYLFRVDVYIVRAALRCAVGFVSVTAETRCDQGVTWPVTVLGSTVSVYAVLVMMQCGAMWLAGLVEGTPSRLASVALALVQQGALAWPQDTCTEAPLHVSVLRGFQCNSEPC